MSEPGILFQFARYNKLMKILANRPSARNIIMADLLSRAMVIITAAVWFMFFLCLPYSCLPESARAVTPFTTYSAPYHFLVAAATTLISALVVIGRVFFFRHLFRHGDVVRARVNYLIRRGNRFYLIFTYLFKREKFVRRKSIRINRHLEKLKEGGNLPVILLKQRPRASYIRDLYL
jgi:hypothetical protein